MQKIFVNKDTNIVEQILKVETYEELPDNYFENCYPILDEEDKINAYNLRYNKETGEFKKVEGVPAKDEVKIIEKNEDINQLKAENEKLKKDNEKLKKDNKEFKSRLEKVEELLNVR